MGTKCTDHPPQSGFVEDGLADDSAIIDFVGDDSEWGADSGARTAGRGQRGADSGART